MNTDPNLEEYPRLVPPDVVYENKASLKKTTVIPLYAKIVSAAAVVALLFGIFWIRSATPKQELMAELKPIESMGIKTDVSMALAESQAHFVVPKRALIPSTKRTGRPALYEKVEAPLLAELQPRVAPMLEVFEQQPDDLLVSDIYYAENEMSFEGQEIAEDSDLSLVGRGIYRLTGGEHDSFASIFIEGLQSVKNEMTLLATTIQSSRSQLRQTER